MITALKGLVSSKKFWSAILGSVIAAVCDQLGVSQDTVFGLLGLFGVQIAGQGLQDMGATKAKVAEVKAEIQEETEGRSPAERAAALADAGE